MHFHIVQLISAGFIANGSICFCNFHDNCSSCFCLCFCNFCSLCTILERTIIKTAGVVSFLKAIASSMLAVFLPLGALFVLVHNQEAPCTAIRMADRSTRLQCGPTQLLSKRSTEATAQLHAHPRRKNNASQSFMYSAQQLQKSHTSPKVL